MYYYIIMSVKIIAHPVKMNILVVQPIFIFTAANKHKFIFQRERVHIVLMPVYRNIVRKTLKSRHTIYT